MELMAPGWLAARASLPVSRSRCAQPLRRVVKRSPASAGRHTSGGRQLAGVAFATCSVCTFLGQRRRRAGRVGVVLRASADGAAPGGEGGAKDPRQAKREAAKLFEPVADFQALKEDLLGSWGFLNDQDFALRAVGVLVLGLAPGLVFSTAVYPIRSAESGEILVRNLASAAFLGIFISILFLLAVLFRLAQQWDSVNKRLKRAAYTVEYDPTVNYSSGSGGAYIYQQAKSKQEDKRDKLLAEYETEPVVARLRVYLLSSAAAAAASFAGAISVGGEIGMAEEEEEEEEEEDDPDTVRFFRGKKKKECKAGCIPGLEAD